MFRNFGFAAGFLCLSAFAVSAQSGSVPPVPKVLLIVREEIKPGMMPAHSREANNVVNIYSKAKSPHHRLAMVPVAGNENEVMYFWPFESLSALERSVDDLDKITNVTHKADFDRVRPALDDDYHSSQRDMIAVLREDLSYRPSADIANMRYMRVQTVRVKPGHVRDWERGRRMIKTAHEKAGIEENMAVFQVAGGAQSNTYLIMIPWRSLEGVATIPHGKAYQDAMGEENWEKLDKIDNDSIVFGAVDIYSFAPQLSYMPSRMVAAAPDFWTLRRLPPATGETMAIKPRKTARKP